MTLDRRQFVRRAAAGALGGLTACRATEKSAPPPERELDLCVIGSGFAGTLIALQAAREGRDVLVIEAGGGPPRLTKSFQYENVGTTPYPLDESRAIAPGGTSALWAGVSVRLSPSDFRLKSLFGLGRDWPIAYEDLEPWWAEAEKTLCVRGYEEIEGAEPPRAGEYPTLLGEIEELPEVELGGLQPRFFPVARSIRQPPSPVRLAQEEIGELDRLEHATLLRGYQACRIVTRDGKTIDHVEVRSADGDVRKVRAHLFVLAAGVIESARLLLLSRSEWFPEGLGNEFDQVGTGFNVHPTTLGLIEPKSTDGLPLGVYRTLEWYDRMREEGLNAFHIQFQMLDERLLTLKLQPEIEPRHENRVRLSTRAKDLFGNPLPALDLSFSERDLATMHFAQQLVLPWIERTAAEKPVYKDRFRFHPASVCRMGSDESNGVVDPDQKLFAVDNLYVSGASVFPNAGTANPTLNLVALTHRLADHVCRRLDRGV